MTPEDNRFLRDFFRALVDRPLHPDDPLYIPIYEDPELRGEAEDPVELLARAIEWSDDDSSVQLFSGFRGAGKTTELFRLKTRLEDSGYVVVHFDIEDYLNASMPVDVSDFLIFVAGAFSDAVEDAGHLPEEGPSYWQRLVDFLGRTRVRLDGVTAGVGAGDVKAGLKATIRTDPDFRTSLQRDLAGHLGTLVADVHLYLRDTARAVLAERARRGEPDAGVVVLVDSVEHIRGTSANAEDVHRSVETLFAGHADKLHLPSLHVIYTVPPYLKVRYSGLSGLYAPGGVQVLHTLAVRRRGTREPYGPGTAVLERVVAARGDWRRLLGEHGLLERIVLRSGGHLRDLLRLLADVVRRADRLPVDERVVDRAVTQAQMEYLPVPEDDAVWLDRIAGSGEAALRDIDWLPRFASFLDTHLVLAYRNGEEWYDVHPLVRDEVVELVGRVAARARNGDRGAPS